MSAIVHKLIDHLSRSAAIRKKQLKASNKQYEAPVKSRKFQSTTQRKTKKIRFIFLYTLYFSFFICGVFVTQLGSVRGMTHDKIAFSMPNMCHVFSCQLRASIRNQKKKGYANPTVVKIHLI